MARVSDPKSIAQWRLHLKKQPRSGLTIEKYCEREGIVAGTFYAWKRRLKSLEATAVSQHHKSSRKTGRGRRRAKTVSGFVQVPLPVNPRIEVRFADGTMLSLPPRDLDALSTTLRTLQAAQLEGGIDD